MLHFFFFSHFDWPVEIVKSNHDWGVWVCIQTQVHLFLWSQEVTKLSLFPENIILSCLSNCLDVFVWNSIHTDTSYMRETGLNDVCIHQFVTVTVFFSRCAILKQKEKLAIQNSECFLNTSSYSFNFPTFIVIPSENFLKIGCN